MQIKEILKKYTDIEIEILLEHVLRQPKEFLVLHPEKKLTPLQLKKLEVLVKRRKKGEPIAYILGYKYFYGLKFKVTKDTLIPRPESEWLVEQVLDLVKRRKEKGESKILDMGTGSGCIAIGLSKTLHATRYTLNTIIHAADISAKALAVAKQNAKANKTKVTFFKSDLFSNIHTKYDIIIANLPYVPVGDYKKLRANLKFEPKSAITDGTKNGDKIITNFLVQAKNHLSPGGKILLEIDPSQAKYFKNRGLAYKDLQKLTRYIII